MTIVVSGMGREKAAQLIEKLIGENVKVVLTDDFEGAMKVKQGMADYYVGMCQSGAGGALAMAIALLGKDKCATISTAGRSPRAAEVATALDKGVVAFGFASEHMENAIPMIIECLVPRILEA